MTAYGTIESAVEAMRLGAYDYIQKPFTEQELLVKVERAVEKRQLAGHGGAAHASSATATSSRTSSAARRPSARCSGAS
jgi:DNA-binding NtrC family response regulator